MVCERADDLIIWIRDRKGALRHCLWVSQRLLHGWRHRRARRMWNGEVEVGQSCKHNQESTRSCRGSICSCANDSRSASASSLSGSEWRVVCCRKARIDYRRPEVEPGTSIPHQLPKLHLRTLSSPKLARSGTSANGQARLKA